MNQKKYVLCLTTTLLLGRALPLTQALAAEQAQQVVTQESLAESSTQNTLKTDTTAEKSFTETTSQSKMISQNTTTTESTEQSPKTSSTKQQESTDSSKVQTQDKRFEGEGTPESPYVVDSSLAATEAGTYYSLVEGGSIENVVQNSTIVNMSGNSSIGNLFGKIENLEEGAVVKVEPSGNITKQSGGIVHSLTGVITEQSGGEVYGAWDDSKISLMSGGDVNDLQGTITKQSGGTVGKVWFGSNINLMSGGEVTDLEGTIIEQSGGTVNKAWEGSTIKTMAGPESKVTTLDSGAIVEVMIQGEIDSITGGLVKRQQAGSSIHNISSGLVIYSGGSIPTETGEGVIVKLTELEDLIDNVENKKYNGTAPYDFKKDSKWKDYVIFNYTDPATLSAVPTAPFDAGTYQVNADIVYGGDIISGMFGGTYTIEPIVATPLFATCEVYEKVYDGKKKFTVKNIDFKDVLPQDKDFVNFDMSQLEATGEKNVGSDIEVTVTMDADNIKITGDKAKNYSLPDLTNVFYYSLGEVTPRPLHVDRSQFSQTNKPFDGTANASLTAAVKRSEIQTDENGIQDNIKIKVSDGFYSDGKIGDAKAITYEWHLDGTDAENYTLPDPKPELLGDITEPIMTDDIQAKIVEKLEKYEPKKIYDGQTDGSFTLDITDCIVPEQTAGETFKLLVDGTYDKKDAGRREFTVTNWEVLDNKATMGTLPEITLNGEIGRKDVSGVWDPATKTYDGTTAISLTGKIEPAELIAGDEVIITGDGNFQQKKVGNDLEIHHTFHTIEGPDKDNYFITMPSDHIGNITKKRVDSFTWQAEDKAYDGMINANAKAESDQLILGDDVTIEGSGDFTSKNVSETPQNVTIPKAGITLSGADKGNYDLAFENEYTAQAAITPYSLLESQIQFIDMDRPFNTTNHSNLKTELTNGVPFMSDDVKIVIENATYFMSDIGSGIPITYDWKLSGSDSGNYRLPMSKPVVTGMIGTPTVEGTVQERIIQLIKAQHPTKVYDGKTASTFNLDITQYFTPAARLLNPTTILLEVSGNFSGEKAGDQTFTASGWKITSGNARIGEFPNESITANGRITKKAVTIDWQGTDKEYDGTKNTEVSGTPQGLEFGDEVTVSGTGNFADKNAGADRKIDIAEIKADGPDAGNYSYPETGTTQAEIFAKPIQISWSCEAKEYDGTTAAHVTSEITGIIADDELELIPTAKYNDANVGNQKNIDIEFSGKGEDVGNYSFETVNQITGDITPRLLNIDWQVADKIYDGTTTAKVSGTPKNAVAGDDISIQQASVKAEFADANAGASKNIHLTNIQLVDNADAQNYRITNETDTTGEIKPKALTITGVTVVDRTVNDSKEVKLDGEKAKLAGVLQQDRENVRFELGNGMMSSVEAGKNKPVTTKIQLTGGAAGNYGLIQPNLTVNISTISGVGAGSNTQTGGKPDNQNKPGSISSAQAKSGRSYSTRTSSQKKPTSLLKANDSVNPAYTGAGIGIASLAAILAWLKRKKR